jgi:glycine cleavage system T protein (aminomethyltransferase)
VPSADPAAGALRRSPVYDREVALGARFAAFGGWSMPLEYAGGGVLKEHAAVREAVGLFDVSHLGKVLVRGAGAAAYVNGCLTNDLAKISAGKAQYTLCCDDGTGGIVDDLIAYLRSDDEVFLVPNAANAAAVAGRLSQSAPPSVEVLDQHEQYAVLAVQGPASDPALEAAGIPVGHDYMSFAETKRDGAEVVVCRTGYTGERGYELVLRADAAVFVWDALLTAGTPFGVLPCGLAARDTLRTEQGYPLHGQDISLDVTPVQAGLGWAVGWGKPAFWGRAALLAERAAGPRRRLRGLLTQGRGIPRPGMAVRDADGAEVGSVTSGTFSPTLRRGIGLALLEAGVSYGDEVSVDVRGRGEQFVVTKPPFVPARVRD